MLGNIAGLKNKEGRITILPEGMLDSDTTPMVEEAILRQLEATEVKALCLDLSKVDYLSSAGLRMILRIKKRYDMFSVMNIRPAIYDVFHMTGFDEMLGTEPPEGYAYEEERPQPEPAVPMHAPLDVPEVALTGINDTTEDYEYRSVIELFEEQARKAPDKLAVVTPTERIHYAQLDAMSNRVANFLVFMGAQPEDVLMILLPRGINAYIATLGVLKAGAAYTVVHADYPDDRIEYIYRDAGCKYIISDKQTVIERLELVADVLQKRPLYMEEMLSNPASYSPGIRNNPGDLCYLIYTSGSTGRPKGVMIEHGSLSNFVYPTAKNHEANGVTQRGTVLLAMAQMTFDVSVMEQYLGLTSGLTVALATEEEILNPLKMNAFLLENRVDAACFTPAYANTLVSIPELQSALAGIQTIDFGAEPFPGSLFDKLRAINPNVYIMNGYGPTEATISCTMKVIESAEDITIGIPNANVYVFVVDQSLNEVSKGEIGELLICGRGVGRGYRNLEGKTREAFVCFKGMRAYRTGDFVRINAHGELEFHGRRDNLVKLRGLRIELDEVENAISGHPDVKLCAAKVFDDRILVAYYVPRKPGGLDKGALQSFARASLAHYMVPELFVELADMPMTTNQKIDRKALERPEIREEEITAPVNATQEKLLAIIRGIFESVPVGMTTNVVDLGLSSLDTMLLAAQIEEAFDVNVNFNDIASHPTAIDLETLLLSRGRRKGAALKQDYPALDIVAFMAGELFEEDNPAMFNLPYLYTLPKDTDARKLQTAVTAALNAYDGLWARFEARDGQIRILRINPHDDYVPELIETTEARFQGLRPDLKRPFTWKGPLFRVELYRTERAVYLFTDFHHSIVDGDSYEILIRQILTTYDGGALRPERYSVFDLHEEAEAYSQAGGFDKALAYYEALLADADGGDAIQGDKGDAALELRRFSRAFEIAPSDLEALARRFLVTPSVLLLGLTAASNAASNVRRSACLTTVFNGRNDSRKLDAVGVFATSFPVFARWTETATALEFFSDLQHQLFTSMGFLTQPFVQLLTRHPETFECGFSFLSRLDDDMRTRDGRVRCEALSPEGTGGTYGIYEEAYERDGSYWFDAEYRANQYEERSVARLFESINAMLSALEPGLRMDELVKRAWQ